MSDPLDVGTFASDADRRAAFEAAAAQQEALDNANLQPVWDSMVAPKVPVMREISVKANRPSPLFLIGILIVGYLLVTAKGGTYDWE
jgi:hypothetical protein